MTSIVPEQAGQRSWLVGSERSAQATAPHNSRQRARAVSRFRFAKKAEVADADQSFGQNVEQKAAQELVC